MSEHHRVAGGWATANPGNREDASGGAAWWPSGMNAVSAAEQQQQQQQQQAQQQQQNLHQHLMNQQQQLNQQQQQAQQQQQQQHHQQQQHQQQQDIVRSTAAGTQQLFSYKMASSFQNPATTGTQSSPVSTSTPVGSCMRGGYDFRLGNAPGSGGGGVPGTPSAPPPGVQWWYPGGVMDAAAQNNLHQQLQSQQQQQQHLSPITTQTSTPPVMSPHQIQQLPQQNNLQQNNAQGLQRDNMPRGKDSKPRGRMTAYAFFVQTCRQEHKKKHPEEKIIFREFSKKCATRWKTMSDKEKKRFHEMAEKDKKRYDAEMQNYTPPKGEKGRGKKRKHIKDHNAPKRSLSAFFWFCNDERGKVKMLNPEYGVGDIAKELGKKWSDADPETKSKYEAMAEKDKARYEREMTAYKKKMKDGAPVVVGAPPANTVKSDSEEEWKEDDE
ncbi:high mobility group protein DSP1-like [Vespa velutina]|uniref:High mobility group protein DSP1-like n=1 Tax=Vespula squamosa TaxID=30214 RepID=A0ABD2C691_VESSQ|nr:high mobility group protein DSP1-like [Vespa crabro]XP_047355906.1 high mobility group protein DSP1-like [Vespa velutina]